MKRLLLLLCLLVAPTCFATDETPKTITLNEGSSVVVEGIKMAFPERSLTALNMVPWTIVRNIEEVTTPSSQFSVTPLSDYYSSSKHQVTPKSDFMVLEKALNELIPIGFNIVFGLLILFAILKFYDAINAYRSTDKEKSEQGAKKLKLALMETVSFAVIAFYLSPNVVEGSAVAVLPLAIMITVWLSLTALVNGVMSFMVDFSNPVSEEMEGSDKINKFQLVLKNQITATVQARLIYDGLLDTSLVDGQIGAADLDKFEVTNHALTLVGEAQRELESSRTGAITSRADCLLRKDWTQVAQTSQECGWVLESATGLGVIDSRLQIQFSEPSKNKLSPSQEKIMTAVEPMIRAELDKYTAYKKSLACVQRHGLETFVDNLEHSFFCKRRRDDFSIHDNQYYGYESVGGGKLIAKSTFTSADSNYSFKAFDDAIERFLKGQFDRVARDKQALVQAQQSKHHNRDLMLSLPTFSRIQTVGKEGRVEAFEEAVISVGSDMETVIDKLFSTLPSHTKELMGIEDKDEVKAYLDKFYPYVTRVWFESIVHPVNFELSEIAKGFIGRVDPSNALGEVTGSIQKIMNLGVMLYGLKAIAAITSTKVPLLGGAATLSLLSSMVVQLAVVLLMFGFLVKLVLHHVFLRLIVAPLFFIINVIKRLIDDLQNVDRNEGDDVLWASFVKTELINPPVMLTFGVVSWLSGVMLFNQFCGLAMMLIKVLPWFSGQGVFTHLTLNIVVYPVVFTFVGYQICYKLPFELYSYITSGMDDEMQPLSVEDDTIIGIFNKAKVTALVKQ